MLLEDQIKNYKELARTIASLEEQKKVLGAVILAQMQEKTYQTPDFLVRRIERLSISISLEDARALNATKMEEAVDKDKIKVLYYSGKPVPGVSEIKFIQVSDKKSSVESVH